MIRILHNSKTTDSMSKTLNKFQDILTYKEYKSLFSLLSTNRCTEFSKPQEFGINTNTGEIRNKIFYCDPKQSNQKAYVDNKHNFIREILPNG